MIIAKRERDPKHVTTYTLIKLATSNTVYYTLSIAMYDDRTELIRLYESRKPKCLHKLDGITVFDRTSNAA